MSKRDKWAGRMLLVAILCFMVGSLWCAATSISNTPLPERQTITTVGVYIVFMGFFAVAMFVLVLPKAPRRLFQVEMDDVKNGIDRIKELSENWSDVEVLNRALQFYHDCLVRVAHGGRIVYHGTDSDQEDMSLP
jgi:hypothetical protein